MVADPACFLIEGEAIQGQQRPDHILSHPLDYPRPHSPLGGMTPYERFRERAGLQA